MPILRPGDLPTHGDPCRWPWLQQLRRSDSVPLEPWLLALERGELVLDRDLVAALADRLDASAQLRLLRRWLAGAAPDPDLPALIGSHRHPATAAWLLDQLAQGPSALQGHLAEASAAALLPLLGHQRCRQAWPVLLSWLQAPLPHALRLSALEGLAVGLPAWPRGPLAHCLLGLASGLDARLAAPAVDLLARLPGARRHLLPLARRPLDPGVERRLRRRLAATPAQPLLLVVHGRAGGEIPDDVLDLALTLEQRRGSPVRIQALSAAAPPEPGELLRPACGLTLVPLLLLPGGHVRHDLPAIVRHWGGLTAVRHLPFLGSWPSWQQALRRELQALAAAAAPQPPLLLHHPLEGALAGRFLLQLERALACRCLATPYSALQLAELALSLTAPALPLALASNRLTDRLSSRVGAPLLQRVGLRSQLLDALEALP